MEHVSTVHGGRRSARAGYAFIEALAAVAAAAAQGAARSISGLTRARRMAAVRREMLGMSDHLLRDIGLNRSQIDQLFR